MSKKQSNTLNDLTSDPERCIHGGEVEIFHDEGVSRLRCRSCKRELVWVTASQVVKSFEPLLRQLDDLAMGIIKQAEREIGKC
jgi:hypothetical protein